MAEGEKDSEHLHERLPIADRDGGSPPSATNVVLRDESAKSFPLRGRVALLIGLLIAMATLYLSLLLLLYRDKPVLELFFETAGTRPPLDLTLNILSLDPVREAINVRIELAKPSESRSWRTLQPDDVRDFVIHIDDRYLTFQISAAESEAKSVVEIALDGSITGYPLDHYTGRLSISASKEGSDAPQPIRLTVWPLLANWNVDISRSV